MAPNTPTVVVIASTYVDMVMKCTNFPSAGISVPGSSFAYISAGPGPIQAIEAALCGCNVYLLTKVGDDPFANMIKDQLSQYNVNTEFILTAKAKNTGVAVTLVDCSGENACCYCPGANLALNELDIEAAEQIISSADVCLINGQIPQEAVLSAINYAKIHGTKIILDPASPIEQTESDSRNLPDEFFNADILIPNLQEATDITNSHPVPSNRGETAKLIGSDLVARGVGTAVITMGKRGCLVVDRDSADHIPAFEVELVDQAAKGDAFAGALAAYCAVDDNIREAVKFASAAGALACTKFGTIEALPRKEEIIELLQKEDTA
jgi:ribokinase